MTEKNNKPESRLTAGLIALLPMMFIAGLFVGNQIWGTPNVGAAQARRHPRTL